MLLRLCQAHKHIDAHSVLFYQSCVLCVLLVPCVLDRVYCPARCRSQPSYWAPVVGNSIYTDVSTHSCPVGLQGYMGFSSDLIYGGLVGVLVVVVVIE